MSVHEIYIGEGGAKFMRPIHTREEYLSRRNTAEQRLTLKAARQEDERRKNDLIQMNYSCLPNEDGSLKGSTKMTTTVGMDIDYKAPKELSDEEKQAWLREQMAGVPELVMSKKEELGLLMLERSATKGYHLVFKRRPDLSQEENLKWASELLGVKFDDKAKDITRVFFTTTADGDELLYLDDEIFKIEEQDAGSEGQEDTLLVRDSKHSIPLAPCPSPLAPQEYNGIPYSDIVAKYWELFNGGKEPVEGECADVRAGSDYPQHLWVFIGEDDAGHPELLEERSGRMLKGGCGRVEKDHRECAERA